MVQSSCAVAKNHFFFSSLGRVLLLCFRFWGDSWAFGSFAQGHIGTSSWWIWGEHTFLRHFLWEASALFPLSGSTALTRVLGIMELFPHTPSPKPGGSCRNSPFLWQGAVQKLYSLGMCWWCSFPFLPLCQLWRQPGSWYLTGPSASDGP